MKNTNENTSEKLKQWSESTAKIIQKTLEIQNGVFCAGLPIIPRVAMDKSDNCYFDPDHQVVNIGIYAPVNIFRVGQNGEKLREFREEYAAAQNFLFGHENQHVLSTASVPYRNGIERSAREIVKWAAADAGLLKPVRTNADMEAALEVHLPKKGLRISKQSLIQFCANVANTVEDGRIERIRSNKLPGFKNARDYFRANMWSQEKYKVKEVDWEKATDTEKMEVLSSALYSLCTTGIYPNGFLRNYSNTEAADVCKQMIPYISAGVMAGKTRQMAENVVKICGILAPWYCRAVKESGNAIENFLKQMIGAMLGADTGLNEVNEATDDGTPNSVFPISDLTIVLPDEQYDKLEEKMKQKGPNGGGGGVKVIREHPRKEDEQNGNETSFGGRDGQGEENHEPDTSSSGSSGATTGKKKEKNGKSAGKKKSSHSRAEPSTQDDKTASGEDSAEQEENEETDADDMNSSGSEHEGGDSSQNNDCHDEGNGENHNASSSPDRKDSVSSTHSSRGGDFSMVQQAMKEAAKKCREEIVDAIPSLNRDDDGEEGKTKEKKVIAVPEEMEMTGGIHEFTREYKLDTALPQELASRCAMFARRNRRYFQNRQTPNVHYMERGAVDTGRLFALGMKDTDVFMKQGRNDQWDGCAYILVDNSGSMSGVKRQEACKAAAVIEEGFKNLMPMKIVAFDYSGHPIHEIIKDWDEKHKKNMCYNFMLHGRNGCGNDDGEDIAKATEELVKRKEQKKMLIVLSDGAPANEAKVKKAVENARDKGISVFGIYFENGRIGSDADAFREMYQKDFVCCRLSELDGELTKLLLKFSRS